MIDLTVILKEKTTVKKIHTIFENSNSNIISVNNDNLVSIDYKATNYSAIIDAPLTKITNGNLLKIYARYDNERGYAERLIDLTEIVGEKII
jgi:glyceraldehyde 3-phosphate dehydrogenase